MQWVRRAQPSHNYYNAKSSVSTQLRHGRVHRGCGASKMVELNSEYCRLVYFCTWRVQLNAQGSVTLPGLVLSPLNDCTGECGSLMLMWHAASSDTLQQARAGVNR